MDRFSNLSSIKINSLNIFAHVGVLEEERLMGQDFLLDIVLWGDLSESSKHDDLKQTLDYALAITSIQKFASTFKCMTIEYFTECIMDQLENLYGPLPLRVRLTKCSPPIDGFTGSVSITMSRNMN